MPQTMTKTTTWFEIPAHDFKRAVSFYETLYDATFDKTTMGGNPYALFPGSQDGSSGGAITEWPGFEPAKPGTGLVLYLYAGDKIDEMLSRVEKAGGRLSTPKTLINDKYGYYSTIIDSEGNRIALHQPGTP
ncbi:MAG: VOC family protein [Balneolales bacterium]